VGGKSDVIATAGVHPYHVNEVPCRPDSIDRLRVLCASDHCHAVGECGLDYSEGFPPKVRRIMATYRNNHSYS
jgi:Tat protein secretion system quality control protein TatD with DNase activity